MPCRIPFQFEKNIKSYQQLTGNVRYLPRLSSHDDSHSPCPGTSDYLSFSVSVALVLSILQRLLQLKYSLATELNLETDPHSVSFLFF